MFSSKDSQSGTVNYIEDVFSTYLYTGTATGYAGNEQNIINGIDVSGKGALIWIKARVSTNSISAYWNKNQLYDTNRGITYTLHSDTTGAHFDATDSISTRADGFRLASGGSYYGPNFSGLNYVSWTFRQEPKFFDIVTYTGNGAGGGQLVNHNLGSVPGFMIIKATSTTSDWYVWARTGSGTAATGLSLNSTASAVVSGALGSQPTATYFDTSGIFDATVQNYPNLTSVTYVAYLFAHNAGGFGTAGTDNVVSCGTYTGTGSPLDVTLGYEPQWVLVKKTSATGDWILMDTMRGMSMTTSQWLYPNIASAGEDESGTQLNPTATGFTVSSSGSGLNGGGATYFYIAIRRGPMKVPTSGTSVFSPVTYTGDGGSPKAINAGFVADAAWGRGRTDTFNWNQVDRLRGSPRLNSNATSAEATSLFGNPTWDTMTGLNGVNGGTDNSNYNQSSMGYIFDVFKRAPSFFDVVCYTGTGSATTQTHNLAAVPELMLIKSRSDAEYWAFYSKTIGNNSHLINTNSPEDSPSGFWNTTTPTSSVFSLGTGNRVNGTAKTYVAFLFATCAGVSKVGSYTGTATTLQIDCGFTSGARFVLIKRTDSTGDWYVWDTARGIISGNDPYLFLNTTAVEVTNTDYIDTYNAGFEISSTAPAAINASAGTYIFLAIA